MHGNANPSPDPNPNPNPDPNPNANQVCMSVLGEERRVAVCGHSLCCSCADTIQRRRSGSFVCPLCSRRCPPPALVSSLRWEDGSSAGSAVHGSWGTKVISLSRVYS